MLITMAIILQISLNVYWNINDKNSKKRKIWVEM